MQIQTSRLKRRAIFRNRSARSSGESTWRKTDRKSTRLNSSHGYISYAVFCLKKKKITHKPERLNPREELRTKAGKTHGNDQARHNIVHCYFSLNERDHKRTQRLDTSASERMT